MPDRQPKVSVTTFELFRFLTATTEKFTALMPLSIDSGVKTDLVMFTGNCLVIFFSANANWQENYSKTMRGRRIVSKHKRHQVNTVG